MIYKVMKECRNFFYDHDKRGRVIRDKGTFEIRDNVVTGLECAYQKNQYIRIMNSVFNDGVYKIEDVVEGEYSIKVPSLIDETFEGFIIPLRVPKDFLEFVNEVEQYQEKHNVLVSDPSIMSESFVNYSYSKASGQSSNSNIFTWQDAFSSELKYYINSMFEERVM